MDDARSWPQVALVGGFWRNLKYDRSPIWLRSCAQDSPGQTECRRGALIFEKLSCQLLSTTLTRRGPWVTASTGVSGFNGFKAEVDWSSLCVTVAKGAVYEKRIRVVQEMDCMYWVR